MRLFRSAALAAIVAAPLCQAGVPGITLETYSNVSGSPIVVTHEPDDVLDRLYVLTRTGTILSGPRAFPGSFSTFMTIPGVDTFFEGGALGMAFHPDFQNNQKFYVYYTEDSSPLRSVVAEYTTTPDGTAGDFSSERRILTVEQGAGNHNGGWIGFGPNDGFLYIAIGDDAFSSNGQNGMTLKGKVLRVDVDGPDAFPADPTRNYTIPSSNPFSGALSIENEIFVTGLRNPYRCSFDRMTGDLYIADVGQSQREEVTVIPASSGGGQNLGWACREGTRCNQGGCCNNAGFTDPHFEYTHANGCSITGGHVYRGCAIEGMDGRYFFADLCRSTVNSFVWDGATATDVEFPSNVLTGVSSPVGFGEDKFGEIYVCTLGGTIFKIVPTDEPVDKNGDGIPDACAPVACQGDCDQDGFVNFSDLVEILLFFGASKTGPCDVDNSGGVDFGDLVATLSLFGPC